MRIGIVLDESLDGTDGVQQYVLRLTERLRAEGHEIFYLVGETSRQDVPNIYSLSRNLHVRFNGNKLSTPLPASRKRLKALLAELNLDVLHVQVPYSPFLAGRLMKLAPKTTAVVGTFHILPYSRTATIANWILGRLNHRTAHRFKEMIAVSKPAAEFAKQYYSLDCQVIPNCFDLKHFLVPTPTVKTKSIVFLGRLVERKGPMELLKAVAWLVEHELWPTGWKVVLGGKGGLMPALAAYSEHIGLEDIVELTGFIAEEDKPAFLAQADIAVFPSIAGESFGISLLEAMAASRGVVLAGDNPGYRSVMVGFEDQLFDPRQTEQFAQLLHKWIAKNDARSVVSQAQKTYVHRFDAAVVGDEVTDIYTKALQKTRTS